MDKYWRGVKRVCCILSVHYLIGCYDQLKHEQLVGVRKVHLARLWQAQLIDIYK